MRTDTIFYQLFQSFDTLLFELVGLPPDTAQGYRFVSAEVKEKAFRFDGIFMPDTTDKHIWFAEVQFQSSPHFYSELFTEVFIYLNQYKPKQDWRVAAIWSCRAIEAKRGEHYRELFESGRIVVVYLDELTTDDSPALGLVRLVIADEGSAIPLAQSLVNRFSPSVVGMLEFIETVLIYKFKDKTREEIEAMFTLGDLKQTRVYQDAKQDGIREGEARGKQIGIREGEAIGKRQTVLRLLARKFGNLPPDIVVKIETLSAEQLENLAEEILDMQSVNSLSKWL